MNGPEESKVSSSKDNISTYNKSLSFFQNKIDANEALKQASESASRRARKLNSYAKKRLSSLAVLTKNIVSPRKEEFLGMEEKKELEKHLSSVSSLKSAYSLLLSPLFLELYNVLKADFKKKTNFLNSLRHTFSKTKALDEIDQIVCVMLNINEKTREETLKLFTEENFKILKIAETLKREEVISNFTTFLRTLRVPQNSHLLKTCTELLKEENDLLKRVNESLKDENICFAIHLSLPFFKKVMGSLEKMGADGECGELLKDYEVKNKTSKDSFLSSLAEISIEKKDSSKEREKYGPNSFEQIRNLAIKTFDKMSKSYPHNEKTIENLETIGQEAKEAPQSDKNSRTLKYGAFLAALALLTLKTQGRNKSWTKKR